MASDASAEGSDRSAKKLAEHLLFKRRVLDPQPNELPSKYGTR